MPESIHQGQSPDLLVIGLGPSGSAALDAALATGADAIGVDQRPAPSASGQRNAIYGSRVWGIFADGAVAITGPMGTWRCTPRMTIVATGAIDIPLPVPGWHLPGVSGARQASRSTGANAGVVVLRGPHAHSGADAPDLSQLDILHDERLADRHAVEVMGTTRVEGVRIDDIVIPITTVVLDNGLQVENSLARMAGIPSTFSTDSGGDAIMPGTIFAAGGSLITVIGEAAGVGWDHATLIEEAVGTATLLGEALLGGNIPSSVPSPRPHHSDAGIPLLPSQATPDTLVCPDEGVTVKQVRDAIERGATTVNDVKRRTRAGMGTCQGRDCLWTIRAMLAEHHQTFAVPMTCRPPVAGISLGELASLGQV